MTLPDDPPRLSPPASQQRRVSTAVIEAVADHAGVEPTDLPPLYESVESDALDALFQSLPRGPLRRMGDVTFSYAGYFVRVTADGAVEVLSEPSGD